MTLLGKFLPNFHAHPPEIIGMYFACNLPQFYPKFVLKNLPTKWEKVHFTISAPLAFSAPVLIHFTTRLPKFTKGQHE